MGRTYDDLDLAPDALGSDGPADALVRLDDKLDVGDLLVGFVGLDVDDNGLVNRRGRSIRG